MLLAVFDKLFFVLFFWIVSCSYVTWCCIWPETTSFPWHFLSLIPFFPPRSKGKCLCLKAAVEKSGGSYSEGCPNSRHLIVTECYLDDILQHYKAALSHKSAGASETPKKKNSPGKNRKKGRERGNLRRRRNGSVLLRNFVLFTCCVLYVLDWRRLLGCGPCIWCFYSRKIWQPQKHEQHAGDWKNQKVRFLNTRKFPGVNTAVPRVIISEYTQSALPFR